MNSNPGPGATNHIIDVTVQNFQEVIEKSRETPVFLEFYADGAEPSQQLAPVLRRLAEEYNGKFILGRIDVQHNPQIVQQLQVRTLPTVKVIFQGQMVQDLEGPQEETQLRQLLDQLTMSPVERFQEQINQLVADGNRPAAIQMLQQALAEEPGNAGLQVELADLLIMESRAEEARQILASLPGDAPGIDKPKSRLAFIDQASDLPSLADLQARVDKDENDLEAQCQLAVRLVVDDRIEAALECLLEVLKKDKTFGDELARKTMIQVFDMLGRGDALATAYRRKMFTFLH